MPRLDAYKLKWIAIIGMVTSHSIYVFYDIFPMWLMIFFAILGGLTYPIMGYFVVEGYRHTSNIKKYMLRLLIFGIITLPFYPVVLGLGRLNIMFNILLALLTLILYDKIKTKIIFWLIFPLILLISMTTEWWFIGIVMILLFHIIRNETARRIIPPIFGGVCWLVLALFSISGIHMSQTVEGMEGMAYEIAKSWGNSSVYTIYASAFMIIGCVAAAFLIKGYNEERGKPMKWLFYIMYPLHFIVIGGIALALGVTTLALVFGI